MTIPRYTPVPSRIINILVLGVVILGAMPGSIGSGQDLTPGPVDSGLTTGSGNRVDVTGHSFEGWYRDTDGDGMDDSIMVEMDKEEQYLLEVYFHFDRWPTESDALGLTGEGRIVYRMEFLPAVLVHCIAARAVVQAAETMDGLVFVERQHRVVPFLNTSVPIMLSRRAPI